MKIIDSGVIIKSYNNNIVFVKLNGMERILFNKGIGFGKKPGDIIEEGTEVEKIFVIEDEDNLRNFKQVIETVDDDFLMLCERMITYITGELKEDLDEKIHIALVDHLNFAIKRLSEDQKIENPFHMEIKALYQTEYALGEKIAEIIQSEIHVNIPEGEIGFIALHIHSARNCGKLSSTMRSTYLMTSIVEYVEENLKFKIEKKSLDYARFLTHLRFAVKRIKDDIAIENDFIKEIKSKYKSSFKIAKGLSKILAQELEKKVTEDEIGYLAMHIERLRRVKQDM